MANKSFDFGKLKRSFYPTKLKDGKTLVVEMGVGMRITKEYCFQLFDGVLNLMKNLGMWSVQVSDKNGKFMNDIVLTLKASEQYSSQGITITFDILRMNLLRNIINIFCEIIDVGVHCFNLLCNIL